MSPLQRALKRLFDVIGSALILIFTSPILLGVAVCIRATMGSPVLFRQERPGLNAKIFRILKFRTMSAERDKNGQLLPDDMRLSPVGAFIRKYSLDELPQFLNVLKGEMSLVGPRPLLVQYLSRYNQSQARRHLVKPGITGWTQVNGRNALTWDEKFQLDTWYVENCSLALDVHILAKTVSVVLFSRGISNTGHATMPEFNPSAHRQV